MPHAIKKPSPAFAGNGLLRLSAYVPKRYGRLLKQGYEQIVIGITIRTGTEHILFGKFGIGNYRRNAAYRQSAGNLAWRRFGTD